MRKRPKKSVFGLGKTALYLLTFKMYENKELTNQLFKELSLRYDP